ncbi:MAG: dipeptidase [Flavobacteriaceae bacterium]|nr:dipeptidase [Flavobacteriaceae bacterium]MDG2499711.1 dipeptidase [Flavobacteriaceae bacterium]
MSTLSENEKEKYLSELFEFLKLPSISADTRYKDTMNKTAEWVSKELLKSGCDSSNVYETNGHPIVYGEKFVNESFPTVLVYGHYDVQPPDPIELWTNPPFEPVIKNTDVHPEGAIFARGACDDKGQVFMHVKAFEQLIKKNKLNCNVKFMIEGEEEVGSNNLEKFLLENKAKLNADVILISDTGLSNLNKPTFTVGLRGLSYMEIKITGPNRDLHSGIYGGALANPINILSDMISSLIDSEGRITIPGFYDEVLEIEKSKRELIEEMSKFDNDHFKNSIGLKETKGEKGYSTLERLSIRPTLDVNGIWGGYIGEGSKTVIPSEANAKISMRLVPNQNWEKISELFTNHIRSITPEYVSIEVTTHHGGNPYITPEGFKGYESAMKAYKDSFGIDPIPQKDGGSIPIVPMFESILGIKTVLMGFGLDSDAIHSPDENYGVKNFFIGIETIQNFYKHFGN